MTRGWMGQPYGALIQELVDGAVRRWNERVEWVCETAYELTDPDHIDRLQLVYPALLSRDPFPVVACWAFREVAQCVSGLWPDCGSIPCGSPCAGGPVLP